jgi:hypothetical protein
MSFTVTLKGVERQESKRDNYVKNLIYKTLRDEEKEQLEMIGFILIKAGIKRTNENIDLKIIAGLREWNEINNKNKTT